MRSKPMYQPPGVPAPSNLREIECHLRLASARRVIDALLGGEWETSTGILDEIAGLIGAASADLQQGRNAALMSLRRGA